MSALHYVKPTPILLKDRPDFNEVWLRERIQDDPSILGLGDVDVIDAERIHPKAGRLDLLLRDAESGKRYEVELMLGTVDESHIIRTIEYWDIERKRWPQYEHTAVIVAERITSRFLNVISLFNGAIPLIAIQLNAIQVGDSIVLSFVKVLDEVSLGREEDEAAAGGPTDRAFWDAKVPKEMMRLVDNCFELLHEINPELALKYNKFHIVFNENGRVNNFVTFHPRKQFVLIDAKVPDVDPWTERVEQAGIDALSPDRPRSQVRFRLTRQDFQRHRDLLQELFAVASGVQGQ